MFWIVSLSLSLSKIAWICSLNLDIRRSIQPRRHTLIFDYRSSSHHYTICCSSSLMNPGICWHSRSHNDWESTVRAGTAPVVAYRALLLRLTLCLFSSQKISELTSRARGKRAIAPPKQHCVGAKITRNSINTTFFEFHVFETFLFSFL